MKLRCEEDLKYNNSNDRKGLLGMGAVNNKSLVENIEFKPDMSEMLDPLYLVPAIPDKPLVIQGQWLGLLHQQVSSDEGVPRGVWNISQRFEKFEKFEERIRRKNSKRKFKEKHVRFLTIPAETGNLVEKGRGRFEPVGDEVFVQMSLISEDGAIGRRCKHAFSKRLLGRRNRRLVVIKGGRKVAVLNLPLRQIFKRGNDDGQIGLI